MEWWKLFSGTFVLIFLAELGDKTQLAAMAKTADSPDSSGAKWVVFLAASLALAASTFIAVFLGHILKSLVPDERYIRLAAAVLFLIFGFTILYETYSSFRADRAEPAVASAEATAEAESSLAGGLAIRAALDFESLAVSRYRSVAGRAQPQLAALLNQIADEEEEHYRRLQGLPAEEVPRAARERTRGCGISGRNIMVDGDDAKMLSELIDHEEATAAFYRDLADRTLIGSVRTVLGNLADDEASHAKRLREALTSGQFC